jgi:hypothetical protein
MLSETRSATPHAFEQFARRETIDRSQLYGRLSLSIARDPELLALAAHARVGQPVPNLLFGAVQYLLLRDQTQPLTMYYPGLTEHPDPGDPFPVFRAFCLERAGEIATLLETRLVQTAHVSRCTCLLPAFELIARRTGRPLALVEIGASAGLNLLWDRYSYEYGGGRRHGNSRSPLQLRTELRGTRRPPLPSRLPEVATRVGLDLNPIDVRDPDQVLWLRALIWPDETGRAHQLESALEVARQDPPTVIAGDALETLPAVLATVPRDHTLCVYHSYTVNQFSARGRQHLAALFEREARHRDLYRISIEMLGGEHPRIDLTSYRASVRSDELLAWCDAHGAWLEWIGRDR